MCRQVVKAVHAGNKQVIEDVRRIAAEPTHSTWLPATPQELCGKIFHTCYMGTSNSSTATRQRAKELADEIGAYHVDLNMDSVVDAMINLFTFVTNRTPRFTGTSAENLSLQNIQARLRMVLAYFFAQLLPWTRGRPGGGSLLVLGSANLSEQLRGYYTKYDCSSSDLNPVQYSYAFKKHRSN